MLETLKCSRIDTEQDDYTKILNEEKKEREFLSGVSIEIVRPSSSYHTVKV